MTEDTYAVIIFWSDDDNAFIASVPDLPGCMAHGETRAQATTEIGIAIENWIDTARAIGREVPPPTQDWTAKTEELEQKARESLKIGFENAMPEIIEALAKEIAKPGTDVLLRYIPGRGVEWLTHEQKAEPSPYKIKPGLHQVRVKEVIKHFEGQTTPAERKANLAGRPFLPPVKRTVRKTQS
jgi:predicted RNase H-like HicB family nuclease